MVKFFNTVVTIFKVLRFINRSNKKQSSVEIHNDKVGSISIYSIPANRGNVWVINKINLENSLTTFPENYTYWYYQTPSDQYDSSIQKKGLTLLVIKKVNQTISITMVNDCKDTVESIVKTLQSVMNGVII